MSQAINFSEIKAAGRLPSPKGVMLSIIRLCQREQTSLPELVRLVQSDPVLAGRIIKMANLTNPNKARPIAAVTTDVLILVGVNAIRQIVLGMSLVSGYRTGSCPGFDYDDFWLRSLAMACAAQVLALRIRSAPPAEMFTCGLMAGIGRLGLATARPEAYSRLLQENAGQAPEILARAESALFEFNHLSLAAMMMTDWNIPRLFADAVLFHEEPERCPAASGSRQLRLTLILHLSAGIADLCHAGESDTAWPTGLQAAAATLDLCDEQLAEIIHLAYCAWTEWADVLQFRIRKSSSLHVQPT